MSALTDYFSSLANKFRSKTGKSDILTPTDMVDEVDAVYQKGYDDATPVTQTKTAGAMPAASVRTITPDNGKLLSSVTIPAAWGGNPKTGTFTKMAAFKPSGTMVGTYTLNTEANCWYYFLVTNTSHSMPIARVNGIDDYFTPKFIATTSSGESVEHLAGIVFKATGTMVSIMITATGGTLYTSVQPIFFKIADP